MNNKISAGVWFVFIGLVVLLHNLNVIHFNFYAIIKYWPLALVSVGVSLLLQGKKNGALISTAANILICIFLIIVGTTSNDYSHLEKSRHTVSASYEDDYKTVRASRNPDTRTAEIEINGGAVSYSISDATADGALFEATTSNPGITLTLDEKDGARNALSLDMEIQGERSNKKPIQVRLDSTAIWDITFNVGAVSVDGDFSPYQIQSFGVNSGASSFKLKFGEPQNGITNIKISTAASSIKLSIPKDVAYSVKSENLLSSIKINGAKKKGDGNYQTDGYAEAENKYQIEIVGAANSFALNTYSLKK